MQGGWECGARYFTPLWESTLYARDGQRVRNFSPPVLWEAIPGMSAIATWMMKGKIEKAQIPALPDLLEMAEAEEVEFVACKMTIDMMGLKKDDFIDGSL